MKGGTRLGQIREAPLFASPLIPEPSRMSKRTWKGKICTVQWNSETVMQVTFPASAYHSIDGNDQGLITCYICSLNQIRGKVPINKIELEPQNSSNRFCH